MTPRERRWFSAALVVILVAVVVVGFLVGPNYAGLTVFGCFVLAAVVGRALLPTEGAVKPQEAGARWYHRWAGALVFAAAVLPYLPTLTLGFLSDDYSLVSGVPTLPRVLSVLAFDPTSRMYRGLHYAAWSVEKHFWGHAALGFHAVNLVFHGLSAVLVWALCRRLTGSRTAAVFAGLLFAVHPVHMEPVAWACGQVDLQATVLALLSLLLTDLWLTEKSRRARTRAAVGAVAAFLLALLTKESTLPMPAVVIMWVGLRAGWRRAVPVGAAFAVILGVYVAIRYAYLGGLAGLLFRSAHGVVPRESPSPGAGVLLPGRHRPLCDLRPGGLGDGGGHDGGDERPAAGVRAGQRVGAGKAPGLLSPLDAGAFDSGMASFDHS